MANKDKYKQLWLEEDLIAKADVYSKNIGTNKTALIRSLLTEFLEGKILANDYITLEDPLYFNAKSLIEEGSIICSSVKPSSDLDNVYIIKKVPNNLDTLKEGCYYYKEPSKHKGINFSVLNAEENVFYVTYLVFDLTISSSGVPELIINVLNIDNLTFYLDVDEDKEIINSLEQIKKQYYTYEAEVNKFYSDNKEELSKGFKNLSEDIIEGLAEIGYNLNTWKAYNYDMFIPVKLYATLKQILILFENISDPEAEKLAEVLHVNKDELEIYINSFDTDNINFNLFLLKVSSNFYVDEVEAVVNSFVNDEDNFLAIVKQKFNL